MGVGTANILLSAADLKKKAGNVITVAESSMRKRQSNRKFEVSSDKYLEKVLTPTLRNSLKCTYR